MGNSNIANQLFLHDKEEIYFVNKNFAKDYCCNVTIFDFDGVLIKETGIAEIGYAWVISSIRDDFIPVEPKDIMEEDVKFAKDFRPLIKGKSMVEKVDIFHALFHKKASQEAKYKLIAGWYDFLKIYIRSQFAKNNLELRLPGSEFLLQEAAKSSRLFGLTANEQYHAQWLMDFVKLLRYFEEIVGFPIETETSKYHLLMNIISRKKLKSSEVCLIGDGVSDIIMGKKAGVLTIGISNNEMPLSLVQDGTDKERIRIKAIKNAEKLLEAGCDILATSTMAYKQLSYGVFNI